MGTSGSQSPPPPAPAGTVRATCPAPAPQHPPPTVRIRAADGVSDPCTIVPLGGSIQLKGVPSQGSGSYQWSTTSTRISLTDATSQTVTVQAGFTLSPTREAETVRLVFTPSGFGALAPVSVGVTVIQVQFSEATGQNYGYDNMDNAASTLHHVSVKKNASTTVHVAIQGGVNGSELEFVCDDTTIAQPGAPPGSAAFDLAVNGQTPDRAETLLKARCRCPAHPECARIYINVYKEKAVNATVAKVYDSRSAGTTLRFPNMSMAAVATLINPKYKAAVANVTLTDHSATGGAVDVRFDLDNNGKLTYEVALAGAEMAAINAAFTVAGQRIVIVRDMVSLYYLEANAAAGATTVTIKSGYVGNIYFRPGQSYPLGTGATRENITVPSFTSNVLTLGSGLAHAHNAGEGIEFPAGGWGGNPVIIMESNVSEDIIKWTYGHELGHAVLRLTDVNALESIMHGMQSWTDHRLRYKPLNLYRGTGTENQWQTISR